MHRPWRVRHQWAAELEVEEAGLVLQEVGVGVGLLFQQVGLQSVPDPMGGTGSERVCVCAGQESSMAATVCV